MLAVAAAELNQMPGVVPSRAKPHVCAPIDANGNLTADDTRTFTWNSTDNPTAVETSQSSAEFTYTGQGLAASRADDAGAATHVIVGKTVTEERSSGAIRRNYDLGFLEGATPYFVVLDHLGGPRAITGQSGSVQQRLDFDPFGRRSSSGSFESRVGFTGHRFVPSQQLLLAPKRVYEASQGRWLSQDPLGMVDGPNLFQYATNNPIKYVDRTGESIALPLPFPLPFPLPPPAVAVVGGAIITTYVAIKVYDLLVCMLAEGVLVRKEEMCWKRCGHLLPSPTGDLQAMEFSKCWKKCMRGDDDDDDSD